MQKSLALIEQVFLGNSLRDWLTAAAVFCGTFLVLPLIRGRIHAHRKHRAHTDSPTLELLGLLAARTNRLVLFSVALYLSERWLTLPPTIDRIFDVVIVFGVALQLGIWASVALRFFIEHHYRRAGTDDAVSRASVGVLMFVGQLLIWALFVLLALDNLGVNITTLVAGLGVGGIAIALAVQTILGDLLGSMSIALDKPFGVGDSLKIDDIEGTVEQIGIKSTRLRSVTGEQIILSNADVLKSRVRNMGRMPERRVLFKLQIAYENPPEKVEQISGIVRGVVEGQQGTRFVQCLLPSLGLYSMEFEVIYFVENQANIRHAETVDAINRGIVREFASQGIAFAYPTRRVLLEHDSAPPPAPAREAAALKPAPPQTSSG